ncbi:DUF1194 domain-containing protein [Oceanibacterium hippocampi]|uniref:VWFA domain-containing protein n=1 Tax=Oceanibacterium hippocampi TaxID=745714 RepID=A0A1Y5R6S5_9PROT|nr:DUF1194 domain-containing protein [Oceanibacterium hippocampi]SLN10506.1 hypothetical protein OCH7691_00046 [Oceanibacterium hippocampi]
MRLAPGAFVACLFTLLAIALAPRHATAGTVDIELVLLADASGSIDEAETLFQRASYAAAVTDPAVLAAMTGGYQGRIALTYVEWGNEYSQDVVVPWTVIDGIEAATVFAEALLSQPRRAFGLNAIGSAIAFAHRLIEENDHEGLRRVIDFSGDSANNWGGIGIEAARRAAIDDDIVINGLAILCRGCNGRPVDYDLEAAFRDFIIGGVGAFVVTADDKASFAQAVRNKMLLEVAGRTPGEAVATVLADDGGGVPD